MSVAECIACGSDIKFSVEPKMGLIVTCDAELEIVWLDPLELDWPFDEDDYEEEDDYYDDDYDDDDE
jgi:lysine biosynthesis protein LysW